MIKHLEKSSGIDYIEDVSDKKEYQKKGIDIIIHLADGQDSQWTADVKLDRKIKFTGNLFIETKSTEKKPGCLLTSEADSFLYLDPSAGKLYYIPVRPLVEFYNTHYEEIKPYLKKVKNENYESEGFCITPEALAVMVDSQEESIAIQWQK